MKWVKKYGTESLQSLQQKFSGQSLLRKLAGFRNTVAVVPKVFCCFQGV